MGPLVADAAGPAPEYTVTLACFVWVALGGAVVGLAWLACVWAVYGVRQIRARGAAKG